MIFKYQLCDGVVTLSDCDRQFAECFSNNVRYIVNPLPFAPEQTECSGYEPNTLVWVGRISEEKQPLDAVHMMNLIVQEMPDATLYMVGDGDEKLLEQIRALIETLGLQENVILTGFTLDVERYYRHASVLVGTSMYEGFPLTFGEALAHSVPIITYDLPWLTYVQDGRGIVTVKQGRYDLLAKEAITLLRDQTRVRQLGAQGNAHLRELASVDIGQEWKTFIEAAVNGTADMPPADRNESILFEYLTRYQQIGRINALNLLNDKLQKTHAEKSELNQKLQKAYAEKTEINRKLQVTYGEKFDRGVQIKELKKQQKELKKDKERLKKELSALKQENADLKKKNKAQAKKLNALRQSSSFRIGRIVTWPVRKLRGLLTKLRH
ncbi:MAG: glycosyltransferase family 4 protein [Clostridiales bacterium]|nr:glycosyltransferase family 4 protein [Clostridiales bacterium]